MKNNEEVICPYCGSKSVVAGDANWFKKSKDKLVFIVLGVGVLFAMLACLFIAKLGYPAIALLLFVFFSLGFVGQYFVRDYLDKRMIATYFCQDCHQIWSK